jgi:hypothetical protein
MLGGLIAFGLPSFANITQELMFRRVVLPGKVYLMQCHFDVKLQADKHVRWDVAERLNRKQMKTLR